MCDRVGNSFVMQLHRKQSDNVDQNMAGRMQRLQLYIANTSFGDWRRAQLRCPASAVTTQLTQP